MASPTQRTDNSTTPSHAIEFTYTACYCEENAYHLCQQLKDHHTDQMFVVFISNPARQIPVWHQRASDREDGLVVRGAFLGTP